MSTRLARSAGLVGAATMTSRVLGVARELVLAALFGASDSMDAFFVAFRIPNLVRDLFAEGAMSAAFVPTFTRYLAAKGKDEAWRLGSLVISTLVIVTGALALAGIVLAGPIVHFMAADFASVPHKLELTVELTRIMLPFLTLVAVAVAMMGMLNSLRHFFIPALSPAMFNVATIAAAFLLVPFMAPLGLPPIAAIAIGALLGGLGQIAVQWPVLRREGYRFQFRLDPKDQGLREILLLMGPGTLGLAAVQINIVVNTILATGQGTGAVSWLNYSFRVMYLPIGLFGVSIATAALPELARHAAADDLAAMRRTLSSGLRMMLMLNVPATIGLVALASPIVALLFERGRFALDHSTGPTAAALMCYAPGLLGYSAVKLASPAFYALRDSRTPVLVSVASVLLNLVLNVTLVRVIGYRGLALGTAFAAIFNASMLLWLLARRLNGFEGRRVAIAFGKIVIASLVMGAAAYATEAWLHGPLPGSGLLFKAVRVFGAIGIGVLVLIACARLLRLEELDQAMRRVLSRFAPSAGRA